MLTENR